MGVFHRTCSSLRVVTGTVQEINLPLSWNKNSSEEMLQKNLGNSSCYRSFALVMEELMILKMFISLTSVLDKDLLSTFERKKWIQIL